VTGATLYNEDILQRAAQGAHPSGKPKLLSKWRTSSGIF
jgi:hypothetical protein